MITSSSTAPEIAVGKPLAGDVLALPFRGDLRQEGVIKDMPAGKPDESNDEKEQGAQVVAIPHRDQEGGKEGPEIGEADEELPLCSG